MQQLIFFRKNCPNKQRALIWRLIEFPYASLTCRFAYLKGQTILKTLNKAPTRLCQHYIYIVFSSGKDRQVHVN